MTESASEPPRRRIYLASSWRNEDQPRILALLRAAGHEVYDFRNPSDGGPPSDVRRGFSWSEIDENWRSWTPEQYREAMSHPAAIRGFAADFNAMRWADTCVVLLPSGPSAALEAGWCAGSGRRVIVHVAGLREPDLMYKLGHRFTVTDAELLEAIRADALLLLWAEEHLHPQGQAEAKLAENRTYTDAYIAEARVSMAELQEHFQSRLKTAEASYQEAQLTIAGLEAERDHYRQRAQDKAEIAQELTEEMWDVLGVRDSLANLADALVDLWLAERRKAEAALRFGFELARPCYDRNGEVVPSGLTVDDAFARWKEGR